MAERPGMFIGTLSPAGAMVQQDFKNTNGFICRSLLLVADEGNATDLTIGANPGNNITSIKAGEALPLPGDITVLSVGATGETGTVRVFAAERANVNWQYAAGVSTKIQLPSGQQPVKEKSVKIKDEDLTLAAVSEAIAIPGVPANAIILYAYADLKEEFTDGAAIATCTVAVGDAGDVDELMDETSIITGAGLGGKWTVGTTKVGPSFEAAYAPVATIAADVNVDTLTAGEVDVYVGYLETQVS